MLKEIEILFRKMIFHLLIAVSKRKRNANVPDFSKIKNVAFIRLNRIGDALVTTPIFSVLKKKYNFSITVVADKKNAFVFRNNPHIDNIIVFKKGFAGLKDVLKELNKMDIVVDLHDDVSTTVSYLVAFCKVPYKFALEKENYKLFSSTITKKDASVSHVIDRVSSILQLFSITEFQKLNVEFYPSDAAKENINNLVKKLNPDKRFFIGFNISAGSDARFWGVDRFRKLISLVKEKYPDIYTLVLSAPGDIDKAKDISTGLAEHYCSQSFEEFAVIISHLDLLFTPDTSTVHLASSAKIPMFGLYVKFNTTNQIWYPYCSEYEAIITEEPNFEKLDVEQVAPKFLKFLEKIYNGK